MAPGGTKRRNWPRVLAGSLVIWAVLAAVVLLDVWPFVPRTSLGWALLLTIGPIGYLAHSALFEGVLEPPLHRMTSERFSARWFAGMAILIVGGCVMVALSIWAFAVYRAALR